MPNKWDMNSGLAVNTKYSTPHQPVIGPGSIGVEKAQGMGKVMKKKVVVKRTKKKGAC